MIVVTVAYTLLGIVPMTLRNLQLLKEVAAEDGQGIQLAGELRYQLEEGRRSLENVILSAGSLAQRNQAVRSMREVDARIAKTESSITQLSTSPVELNPQFHQKWITYLADRDRLIQISESGGAADASDGHQARSSTAGAGGKFDTEREAADFLQVDQAAARWEKEFQSDSDRKVGEISRSLRNALSDWLSVVVLKVLILALLIWTDWKRRRVERELRTATEELRASQDRLQLAYGSSAVGMGIISMDGTILSVNGVAARMLSYEPTEMIGKRVRDFIAPEFQQGHIEHLASLADHRISSYQAERQYIRKDGTAVWIRNNVNCMRLKCGERQCFFTSEDITHQKLANDRLAFLAHFDPVTSLPNRHSFEEQLAEALEPESGKMPGIALLYLEIDSFDFLKGTFGRNVADDVLSELSVSLSAFQLPGEVVGRLDDHVFGVLTRAAPYDAATMDRATQLRDIFHRFGESGKHRIPISASIGIAYSGAELNQPFHRRFGVPASRSSLESKPETQSESKNGVGHASETLLKFARAAMLEARSRGGDAIYVADPALQERAAQRHQIESALLRGLRQDEFRVVFQPQFHVATGRLVRFEALCRWSSAELGTISPDRFIPIAEQTGLIAEIGRRVMHDALQQATKWAQSGHKIGVAVNISPMQFMRPDFTQILTEVLANSGFPPELLELEITEGIFIRDLNLAVARIRELQRLGLSIALDDFGTGYSSLSYLQRMPIDAVKLDRSFVSDLTTDAATVSMVRSVLSMAEALHLRVVSEGVETDAQLQILRSLGCDEAQGYLLGRPESAELALRRVLDSPLQPVGARV